MNFMIVPRILFCSSFLISVYMFIVSKALHISSATVIVRAGGTLCYCVINVRSAVTVVLCGCVFCYVRKQGL